MILLSIFFENNLALYIPQYYWEIYFWKTLKCILRNIIGKYVIENPINSDTTSYSFSSISWDIIAFSK